MTDYRQYRPAAPLADFIECYWVHRSPGNPLRQERLIPGGRVEMIFNFADPFRYLIHEDTPGGHLITNVHFMGQRDQLFFGRHIGHTDMLGIRFKTGGLTAFTPVPVSSLLNRMIPAEDVLGTATKEWEAALYEKKNDRDRLLFLDRLFLGMLGTRRHLPPEWHALRASLDLIRNSPEGATLQAICHQTGWYYKKLERTFLKATGYTPKLYSRIVRFNKAIRRMHRQEDRSLTATAYECGYYDQAHFIKDFHRFAGATPGNFQPEDDTITQFLIRHQPV